MKIALNIPTKVVLLVELVILIAFGFITYRLALDFQESSVASLEQQANALAQVLLHTIHPQEIGGTDTLQQGSARLSALCQELYSTNENRGVTHVAFIDASGAILAHSDPNLIGTVVQSPALLKSLGWQKTISVLDEDRYHILVPILREKRGVVSDTRRGNYAGSIDIGYSKAVQDKAVSQFLLPSLRIFIATLLVTFFVLLGVTYVLVTKPVRHFVRLGNQIAQGQLIESTHFTQYKDERALLGQTFVDISTYFREVTELATHIAAGRLDQQQIQKHSKRDVLANALQEMLNYLRTVADIAKKIAEGDLTMMAPLRSDQDAFGRALQQMIASLREMAQVATSISTGDLRGQIAPRSEQDELGIAFQSMTGYLTRLAGAATVIAEGDLKQKVQPESEHDVLGNAFHTMAVRLRENFEKIQQEIAERTRAQEALQQLNNELEQRVEERTFELATAYKEIQILNEQLKEENWRMGAELDVARQLQQMILPSQEELRQFEDLEIVGYMRPADEVGGDYYDIVPCEQGQVYIGIGDVTGHGLQSGVLMLMAQTAVRTLIDRGETDPVAFLNTLNRVLYENIQRMGADKSMSLGFLHYKEGSVKLIGQHEDMLVVRKNGQVERMDTVNLGFPLGMVEDISQWVAEATVPLEPGDGLVLYTDGITEAENEIHELYGLERVCEVVSQHWHEPAEQIKQAVIDDVLRHIGQQTVYDDLTMVVLKQH